MLILISLGMVQFICAGLQKSTSKAEWKIAGNQNIFNSCWQSGNYTLFFTLLEPMDNGLRPK
jgi:hypothetical protein